MFRQVLVVVATTILVSSGITNGQLVQVSPYGGVQVNAPFVRVEVGPAGETYVRAPFTSVYSPGRPFIARPGFSRPYFETVRRHEAVVSVEPTATGSLAVIRWSGLRQHLRGAASQLITDLDRLADGDVWRDYLRPDAVMQLASENSDRVPDPDEMAQFQALYETFKATTANPELRRITDLPGFRAVYDGLHQVIARGGAGGAERDASPDNSLTAIRAKLASSAVRLDRELRRFPSSANLRSFLELPLQVYSGEEGVMSEVQSTEPDLAELELALRRFDRVSRAAEYRSVASLQSFRDTRRVLSQYVQALQQQSFADQQPTPAEPLPVPQTLPE